MYLFIGLNCQSHSAITSSLAHYGASTNSSSGSLRSCYAFPRGLFPKIIVVHSNNKAPPAKCGPMDLHTSIFSNKSAIPNDKQECMIFENMFLERGTRLLFARNEITKLTLS